MCVSAIHKVQIVQQRWNEFFQTISFAFRLSSCVCGKYIEVRISQSSISSSNVMTPWNIAWSASKWLLFLPLLLWAGNPETKTVTAGAEQYASL